MSSWGRRGSYPQVHVENVGETAFISGSGSMGYN